MDQHFKILNSLQTEHFYCLVIIRQEISFTVSYFYFLIALERKLFDVWKQKMRLNLILQFY